MKAFMERPIYYKLFIPFSKYDTLFYDPVIYRELLLRGTVRTLIAIFDPHIIREHFLVTGFAGTIPSVFFLIGLALSLRLWKQLRFGLPLIWLASGLLFLSIIAAFPPRQTHLVSIIPAFAMISGVGLCATVESLAESIFPRRTHLQSTIQRILLAIASIVILYFGVQKYFVSMPAIYPPLFEDIASWIAWKTERPADLIYLGQDDKPHRVEYLLNANLVHHKYRSLLLNDFSPDIISTENKPTIIFIESKDEISKLTIQKLPGFSVPIPYQYTDGTIIGYVMTNTVIDLTPKVDREEGWGSLTDTPVRWILIVLAVVGAVSGLFAFRKKRDGSYE
jgi:hypothetical protein